MSQLVPPKRLYRAMKAQGSAPVCGNLANELGVRPGVDIIVDGGGQVHPSSGGLSTTPDDLARLPPHVRPPSLGGRGKLPVFVIEVARLDGPAAASAGAAELVARRDPKHPVKHAFIEPAHSMSLAELQGYLCATSERWARV